MPIVTIRPSATKQDPTGEWTRVGGTTKHGVLADNSDSTYLRNTNPGIGQQDPTMELNLGSPLASIPTANRIKRVRSRIRVMGESWPVWDWQNIRLWVIVIVDDQGFKGNEPFLPRIIDEHYVSDNEAANTKSGPWYITPWKNIEAPRSILNKLLLGVHYSVNPWNSTWKARLLEAYFEIDHTAPPTNPVNQPAHLSTIATTLPTIGWTYSHPENYPQNAYHVKVFSSAQYNAGGFNPATSPSTWDSGQTNSPNNIVQIGTHLSNGTYRAYVRTKVAWGGANDNFWSSWAFSQFTVNVVPPPQPTISLSQDSDLGQVLINIQSSGTPAPEEFVVERTYTNAPYHVIAGGIVPAGSNVTVIDHGAIPLRNVQYRVRGIRYVAGAPVAGAYSFGPVINLALEKWLLKDTYTGEVLELDVEQDALNIESGEDKAAFNPLGNPGDQRKTPAIVVKDSIRGEKFPLTLGFLGQPTYAAFRRLRESQHILLLQAPTREGPWFCVFDSPVGYKVINMNDPEYRQVNVDVIEVDFPVEAPFGE